MIFTVGVLFDYFAAPSDETAAEQIEDGPGDPLLVVATKGIDPVVQLGTLEALLTGLDVESIIETPRSPHVLAERDGGERLVLTLRDEIKDALAAATPDQLAEVAYPWSQTDEFFGQGDPEQLTGLLLQFADLARQANQLNQRLYCWICV